MKNRIGISNIPTGRSTPLKRKMEMCRYYLYRFLFLSAMAAVVTAMWLPTYFEKSFYESGDPVVVDVAQGRIVGEERTQANYTFHAFLSIPYARPPTGELRFKNPEPADPWEGDLDATVSPSSCPQFVVWGKEDCLYLNVYTPPDSIGRPEPLPVMVYFHGGAFYLGGSFTYHGIQPLVQHDVILVILQYRLGVLGFLSTEDEAAPGNLGLKDQTLALRWVNENIEAFGGDKDRITIFGESAGAASVHYQILSPYAAGLFSGAIMQSGSAFTPWSKGRDFNRVAREVAERFHCPTEPSDELITCLQKKSRMLLDEMAVEFIEFNFQPFYFAPRIDGDFIPDHPVSLVKQGRYNHVPVMMGVNRDEGSLLGGEMYWDRAIINALVTNFTKNGPPSLELYSDEDPHNTAMTVYNYYLGGLNFEYEDADNVTKLYGDRLFNIPLDWLTKLVGDVDDVYRWELRHRGRIGVLGLFPGLNRTLKERWICHGDELQYLFHPGIFGTPFTEEDVATSDLYTTMWTNFAKTRNPTPDDSLGFTWEKTNGNDLRKLVITANPPLEMESDTRETDRSFWESLPLRINDLLRS